MDHKVVTDYTDATTGNDNIKVFVRSRPTVDGVEPPKEMWTLHKDPSGKLSIKDPSRHVGEHAFLFDSVFWTDTPQESIYHHVARPLVEHVLKGFNGCCFAYGQTGSGKTYSMFGELGAKRGIIPRCADHLFEYAAREKALNKSLSVQVSVSMLEMYCDEIRDLGKAFVANREMKEYKKMNTSDWYLEKVKGRHSFGSSINGPKSPEQREREADEAGLAIHEDLSGNVYVKNLSVIPVEKSSEVHDVLERGFRMRATHETKMNKYSSRSHTIVTITVTQHDSITNVTTTGNLNLVDLAGSERLGKSEAEGQRLKETLSINTSLSALGKIAAALDPSTPAGYIPYRDSKLTRLLQNSLGGNSHTSVVATLHPTRQNYDECLSTLQFANRCRAVVNQPRINYTDAQGRGILQETIRRLQAEIKRLRLMMAVVLAKKNKQFQEILQQLGHAEATVLSDGRVQLASGKLIGAKLDLKSIERQVTSVQQRADLGSAAGGGMVAMAAAAANLGLGPITSKEQLLALNHSQQVQLMAAMGLPAGEGFDLANLDLSQADLMGQFGEMGGGDGSMFNFGGDGSQDFGDGLGVPLTADERQLRNMANTYKLENRKLKERIATDRKDAKKAEAEARAAANKAREEIKVQRATIAALKRQLDERATAAASKLAAQRDHYQGEMRSVVKSSLEAQTRTEELVRHIPQALKVDSAKIHAAKRRADNLESELTDKHGNHTRKLLKARDNQLENVKAQARYWVEKKDEDCRRLVDDFNRYHQERTAQVREFKRELHMLYEHCNELTKVISKAQQGEYRIKVSLARKSRLREICVRSKDKPDGTLVTDEKRLRLLKEQIKALQTFQVTNGLDSTKARIDQFHDEQKPQQGTMQRTASVPAVSCASSSDQKEEQASESEKCWDVLSNIKHRGVELDADVSELGNVELQEHVAALRSFVTSDYAAQVVEQRLLRKISSNATVSYIKTLEEGLETYKQSFRAEAESHKQLRVAYQSLKRRAAKRSKPRPSTSKR